MISKNLIIKQLLADIVHNQAYDQINEKIHHIFRYIIGRLAMSKDTEKVAILKGKLSKALIDIKKITEEDDL